MALMKIKLFPHLLHTPNKLSQLVKTGLWCNSYFSLKVNKALKPALLQEVALGLEVEKSPSPCSFCISYNISYTVMVPNAAGESLHSKQEPFITLGSQKLMRIFQVKEKATEKHMLSSICIRDLQITSGNNLIASLLFAIL